MTTADGPREATSPGREFAHASEAEMARILDFYAVRWEYEPRTFPILWNLDGAVVESFAPDFYLPDLDLYLEMTTLRQKLVRKKNRKLRRLKELYPDINIKLFYARDFRALMLKYGKLALVGELSGTPGQVGARPELAEDLDSAGEAAPDAPAVEAAFGLGVPDAPTAAEPTIPAASIPSRARARARRRTAAPMPSLQPDASARRSARRERPTGTR
jgi:hypoxanthine phosphoribosyltransferase